MSEARLGSPRYTRKVPEPDAKKTPSVVRPCVGCGGETAQPPKTPAEAESFLAENVNLQ